MGKNTLAAACAAVLFISVIAGRFFTPVVLAANEVAEEDLSPLYQVWQTQRFLKKYNSPLEPSSRKFIMAELNNIQL